MLFNHEAITNEHRCYQHMVMKSSLSDHEIITKSSQSHYICYQHMVMKPSQNHHEINTKSSQRHHKYYKHEKIKNGIEKSFTNVIQEHVISSKCHSCYNNSHHKIVTDTTTRVITKPSQNHHKSSKFQKRYNQYYKTTM